MKEEDISRSGCSVIDIASKVRVAVSYNGFLFIAAKPKSIVVRGNQVCKDLFYGFLV
jgi:hypothetical protein